MGRLYSDRPGVTGIQMANTLPQEFHVIRVGEAVGTVQSPVSAGFQLFRQELVGDFFNPDVPHPARVATSSTSSINAVNLGIVGEF